MPRADVPMIGGNDENYSTKSPIGGCDDPVDVIPW